MSGVEGARPIITDWLRLGGLREALAVQVASDEGITWDCLLEEEKTTYRETADNLCILITEWDTET